MRAVGILAGMVVATFFLFMYLASGAGTEPIKDDMQYQRLAERIAPQAKVAVAGQDNTALNAGDTARAAPPPAAPAAVLTREPAFRPTFIARHAPGDAGAPHSGDRGPWAPRPPPSPARPLPH